MNQLAKRLTESKKIKGLSLIAALVCLFVTSGCGSDRTAEDEAEKPSIYGKWFLQSEICSYDALDLKTVSARALTSTGYYSGSALGSLFRKANPDLTKTLQITPESAIYAESDRTSGVVCNFSEPIYFHLVADDRIQITGSAQVSSDRSNDPSCLTTSPNQSLIGDAHYVDSYQVFFIEGKLIMHSLTDSFCRNQGLRGVRSILTWGRSAQD